MMYEMRIVFT